MPYSRITRTAHGADAIRYIKGNGKGHNGSEIRNNFITGINMLPDNVVPFEGQMQTIWNKASARHTIQVDRFIVSFSQKELDAKNPVDVAKAHHIGCEFARLLCNGLNPDNEKDNDLAKSLGIPIKELAGRGKHQAVVATQTDGKGGCIHIHIAVNDNSIDTNKGLNQGLYLHSHIAAMTDYLCQQYFELDVPKLASEKEPQSVRGLKIKNAEIEKANAEEIKQAQNEGRTPELQPFKYIWLDDLKERIREAAQASSNETEFMAESRNRGVEVEKRKATKKQPEHYTYELIDVSGFSDPTDIPQNLKRKSYKLGANYQPEGIAEMSRACDLEMFLNSTSAAALPDIPVPTAKKKTEKPADLSPEEKEKRAMERVEDDARSAVWHIYAAAQGWGDKKPTVRDEKGIKWDDYEEMGRRHRAAEQNWEEFKQWRVQQHKAGNKLPDIYDKNKETGRISVIYEEVEKQYRDFLYSAPDPVSEKKAEETQTVCKPTKKKPAETLQQTEQRTPQQQEANRQREQNARRIAALTADTESMTKGIKTPGNIDPDFDETL